ncbi:MAG: mannose-6-phosphate isomerase-like protein (cupin superfamily) [Alphaproteobacteria bacterium]|jgi:mannose-6-phosphate isomerase-like protein (cupin superfamily)
MSQQLKEKNTAEVPEEKLSHYEVLLDNDTTKITFHHIRPGEQSGWHLHGTDYVGYHIEAGKLRYEKADGSTGNMISEVGKANFYEVGDGFEHNVTNIGDTDMVALEIEYKKG